MAEESPPRISIIIPAYNYEKFVAAAIESALGQEDGDFEIIVVDDGSKDRTGEVASSFGERIRYIRKENAGLPAARNTGIGAARGKYFVFLDADDIMFPHTIGTLRRRLESLPEGFGLVGCSHREVTANGELIQDIVQAPPDGVEITVRDLIARSRFCPCVITRADAIRKAGLFDESLRACEDRDMWIRIAAAGSRVFVLPDVLIQARRHGDNMSADSDRQTAAIRKVLGKAQASGVVPKWDFPFWARTWSIYHYQKSTMLWNRDRRWEARKHLLASLLIWPWFLRPGRLGKPLFFRIRRLASWMLKRHGAANGGR